MKKIFTLLLLLLGSTTLFAQTIYYVKPTGNDANSGRTWATAFKTLQKALATISTGQIWVAAGTYYPDEGPGLTNNSIGLAFRMKNNVALYGGFAGTETTLSQRNWAIHKTILSGDVDQVPGNAGNSFHVIKNDMGYDTNTGLNRSAVLDGFTITDANNPSQLHGGGIFNFNASPTIINCIITRNAGYFFGGGVYNDYYSSPLIINCTISENTISGAGTTWGAAICNDYYSTSTLINCTIWGNRDLSSGYGGIANVSNSSSILTNCIVWGNSGNQFRNWPGYATVTWSIVQGGFDGTGNLNRDPLFVDAPGGDLRLQPCSPAIDAGTNTANTTAVDLGGNPRILYNTIDMGAYESPTNLCCPDGNTLFVKKDATGNNKGSSWANAFTSLQDALAYTSLCANVTQIWVAAGTYYPDEGGGKTDNDRTASFVLKNNVALYGGFTGTETTLSQRTQATDPTILSGDLLHNDGPEFTNNGDNAYHVVTSSSVNSTAVLDGFTITGGNANGSGAQYLGGGMYNFSSSPTVVNCSFAQNAAGNGGGLYNQAASPALSYCRFVNNQAHFGAGVYNQSTAVVSNCNPAFTSCSFRSNSATQEGGALYNLSSSGTWVNCVFWDNTAVSGAGLLNNSTNNLRLTNCTFAHNTATSSGGALYNLNTWGVPSTLTNCILWTDQGGEIAGEGATVTYSLVQGGHYGTGNLNADPLFRDAALSDLRLRSGSPAINAGNDAAVPATVTTDLDGNPRFNGRVDMGAYEYASAGSPPPGPYKPLMLVCPDSITLQSAAGDCGAFIDFDAAQLASVDGGTAPIVVTYSPASGNPLPIGTNTITVTATDSKDETKTCSFTVTVVDATPPVISNLTVDKPVLYPPNHKLQDVTVSYGASDNCAVASTTFAVTSNEAPYGSGSGDTGPDWQVIDNHKVKLRAERSGTGTGRVYTITVTAKDVAGNESTATTTVTVPHDKGAPVTGNKAVNNSEVASLTVQAVPNPSSEGFTLTVQSPSTLPLTIKVMDGTGRIIEQRAGVAPNGTQYIGNQYRPGVYYLQVLQGSALQTIRLIKQAH